MALYGTSQGELNPLKPDALQYFISPSIIISLGGMGSLKEKSPSKLGGKRSNL